MPTNPRPTALATRKPRVRARRSGAVTIEFLVVLPVLAFALVAGLQFGYYFQRAELLALASRIGAEQASQTAGLPGAGAVPTSIADVVNHHLASNGITTTAIIVEHNTTGPEQTLRTDYQPNSIPEPVTALVANSVRVTVCVPLSSLMPNCLATFGFDISTRYAVHTTTFGYEL